MKNRGPENALRALPAAKVEKYIVRRACARYAALPLRNESCAKQGLKSIENEQDESGRSDLLRPSSRSDKQPHEKTSERRFFVNATSGCGGIGRRARFRFLWETVWVRVPSSAPTKRQPLGCFFCWSKLKRGLNRGEAAE